MTINEKARNVVQALEKSLIFQICVPGYCGSTSFYNELCEAKRARAAEVVALSLAEEAEAGSVGGEVKCPGCGILWRVSLSTITYAAYCPTCYEKLSRAHDRAIHRMNKVTRILESQIEIHEATCRVATPGHVPSIDVITRAHAARHILLQIRDSIGD